MANEMATLWQMLDALADGQMTTEEAVAWARQYVWAPVTVRAPERNPFAAMQQDADVPLPGSWADVDAAYFSNRINSAQRTALMNAYLEHERSERPRR